MADYKLKFTAAEIDEKLDSIDNKQDKITGTADDFVVIGEDGNITTKTISYSEMQGATSSVDGASGLVPTPAAGDQDKFLKGDGTWAEAGGGGDTVTTVIGTTWVENEDTGVKSQTISIPACTGSDDEVAKVDVYYNGNDSTDSYATFVEQQNQFLEFITNGYGKTVNGAIVLYIFGEPNTVEIPIVVEVS